MKPILVEEVYQLSEPASLSVPEGTSLQEVVTRLALMPELRAVFLVDSHERFAGTLRRADLLKWLYFQLFGKFGVEKESTGEVLRVALATKAKDLARGDWRYFGVTPSDTIQTALERMIAYGDAIIPVLDNEGKVLGDLRVTGILMKALQFGETDQPPDLR
jgi:CBS-domain-containing membrane protein